MSYSSFEGHFKLDKTPDIKRKKMLTNLEKNACGWFYDESDNSIFWNGIDDYSYGYVQWLRYIIDYILVPDNFISGKILVMHHYDWQFYKAETIEIINNNIKVYETTIDYFDDERIVNVNREKDISDHQEFGGRVVIHHHYDSDDEEENMDDDNSFIIDDNFELNDDDQIDPKN